MKNAIPPIAARLEEKRYFSDFSFSNTSVYLQSGDHVVPDEMGVVTQRDKSLSDSGGDGVGEQSNGLNDGTHVFGSLGVGVFQDGNRGKDFRETNEGV